ncbi:MAG: biotin transporter BioY [Bacteroidota bacterium]
MRRRLAIPIFALLMAVGAQVELPLGPVPFILSDFFVLLAGLVLGPRLGGLSTLLYLTVGILGVPVFADGGAGLTHLAGPTGGYLIGYFAASVVVGVIAFWRKPVLVRDALATLSGQTVIFAFGLAGLKLETGMPWAATLEVGLFPFAYPIAIKFAAAVLAARLLRPLR